MEKSVLRIRGPLNIPLKLQRCNWQGHSVLDHLAQYRMRCFVEHIISRIANDDITRAVKSDHLLLSLGTVLFEKLGSERANEVRSRMRNGTRLKMKLQEITNRHVALENFITGSNFDNCAKSVRT